MKDKIEQLRQIIQTVDSVEVKDQIDSIASGLISDYESLQTKLKLTTKQSIGRKQKMSELYQTVDNLRKLEQELNITKQQNEKLSKYRQAAVNEKKLYNERIKTFFQTKLSNQTNKDYAKMKQLHNQFNFQSDEQSSYDANKRTYELLELAGVFGNDKIIGKELPKSAGKTDTNKSSRWNKN